MPIGPQPRRARGTVGHAYSSLNLRLVLALFGLAVCIGLGVLAGLHGYWPIVVVLGILAIVAVVDLVVITLRLRARRRQDTDNHSLFE